MKRDYYDKVDMVQDTILYEKRHGQRENYAGIFEWFYDKSQDNVVRCKVGDVPDFVKNDDDYTETYIMTTEDGNIYPD